MNSEEAIKYLNEQVQELDAESKLYAGIIRQLNDDNKATQALCERLAAGMEHLREVRFTLGVATLYLGQKAARPFEGDRTP